MDTQIDILGIRCSYRAPSASLLLAYMGLVGAILQSFEAEEWGR
jgi:hypothetical protein